MKATHNGNCQLCGKLQKLPSGLLSNHGYEVKWNMFNGVCPGSKELPYQLSCEAIKRVLASIEGQINTVKCDIGDINNRSGSVGYFRVYGELAGKSCYYWTEVEFLKNEHGKLGFEFKGKKYFNHCLVKESPELAARFYDNKYVDSILVSKLNNLIEYKTWCLDRIKNWTLSDVFPI